ncbi:MAG: hypothetical protein LN413_03360 [Candidatus Thermoplasmatota archaeon]|nr:hypothetical protein [Candidatus Thermoplasmatota archaeon]
MSRGGWIMIIGGIVLLVGIGLFAFGTASFLSSFAPDTTTLSPGAFQNLTVDVQSTQSALMYLIGIQDFAAGDELTVFIRTPSGAEVQRAAMNSASPLTATYITTETGVHTVVVENTGAQSVTVIHAANEIDFMAASLITIGTFLGFGGFVVFIIGLILWIMDRGRARRQRPTGMPPPPTSPPYP